ncbi:hypothetical protein [Streptosporangium sp. NBC_01756]|uniref:hypothetical protein n=1 Tax=Streptosporangium sp. NBC_01756 TaxID=2975950 RepID=UPI002DD8991E|nr:hypothetical protein [Streptosporangium sp. NBC_01756]WSC88941.1 hypothetical protein OIE48_12360 [Streptosporangium sp. NBC_01756]
MTITEPHGLQPILNAMGVSVPRIDTDGMQRGGAEHAGRQAGTDQAATHTLATIDRTIGSAGQSGPAYTGDAADALGRHSAHTRELLAQTSAATQHIPAVLNGAAKVVTSAQTAVIAIAVSTAVSAYVKSLSGGPLGPAQATAEILRGRQRAGLVLNEASHGANTTIAGIFRRLVTKPLQNVLERLRFPSGGGPLPATGPTISRTGPVRFGGNIQPNRGHTLMKSGKPKGGDGASNTPSKGLLGGRLPVGKNGSAKITSKVEKHVDDNNAAAMEEAAKRDLIDKMPYKTPRMEAESGRLKRSVWSRRNPN